MAAPFTKGQVRRNIISNAGRVKSFVDDSSRERAIVSMRVISVSRSTETRLVLRFVTGRLELCSCFSVTPPPTNKSTHTMKRPARVLLVPPLLPPTTVQNSTQSLSRVSWCCLTWCDEIDFFSYYTPTAKSVGY
jgi:hypothetical protein